MAWGDLAKVGKLLASLSSLGKDDDWQLAGSKKGGAKAKSGVGGKAGGKSGATKQCPWEDCRAGRQQQPTYGDQPQCHCCGRKWASLPPIEKMTEAAYKAKLKSAEPTPRGARAAPKAKARARATQQKQVGLRRRPLRTNSRWSGSSGSKS